MSSTSSRNIFLYFSDFTKSNSNSEIELWAQKKDKNDQLHDWQLHDLRLISNIVSFNRYHPNGPSYMVHILSNELSAFRPGLYGQSLVHLSTSVHVGQMIMVCRTNPSVKIRLSQYFSLKFLGKNRNQNRKYFSDLTSKNRSQKIF